MAQKRFAQRYGISVQAAEITIQDDAPEEVRGAILVIAQGEMKLEPSTLRSILCTVLRKLPDGQNWSEYPNVWCECQSLVYGAPWYRIYDFVEAVHAHLEDFDKLAEKWTNAINDYFVEAGVGWRMVKGLLERRGTEAFVSAVDNARATLSKKGQKTAHDELQEAMHDLSRRPKPDLTGAVQHAVAALECTAREATGNAKATFGEIIKRYPDLVPKPLDEALAKMWGYSSEFARHLREGQEVAPESVELIVTISAAVCTFLAKPTKRAK